MERIDAVTDTAEMVNGHVWGNVADAYLIGHAVGSVLVAIMPELPIPTIYNLRHPRPAFVRCADINLRPEAGKVVIMRKHRKPSFYDVMRRAVSAVPSPLIVSQGVSSLSLR